MKTIILDSYGIEIALNDNGGAMLTSDLERETCPFCGEASCCYSCDESTEAHTGEDEDVAARMSFNGVLDGIEALILAHAAAAIDVTTPAYLEGIETAVEAAGNNA